MHEKIFYNGFNLAVDLFIGISVWIIATRAAWFNGYKEGVEDVAKGHVYLDYEIRETLCPHKDWHPEQPTINDLVKMEAERNS